MRYIIALLLLFGLIVLIWTSDLENNGAIRWLTTTEQDEKQAFVPSGEVVFEEGYRFAWDPPTGRLLWVAYELGGEVPKDTKMQTYSVDTSSAPFLLLDTAILEESEDQYIPGQLYLQLASSFGPLWDEFKAQCRYWSEESDRLYIVIGPIPEASHKTSEIFCGIVRKEDGSWSACGFILPVALTEKPILQMAVSIDSLEILTGIDLFPDLVDVGEGEKLESTLDVLSWGYDVDQYQRRISGIQKNKTNE